MGAPGRVTHHREGHPPVGALVRISRPRVVSHACSVPEVKAKGRPQANPRKGMVTSVLIEAGGSYPLPSLRIDLHGDFDYVVARWPRLAPRAT